MKAIVVFVSSILMSSLVFASLCDKSWSELNKDFSVQADFTKVMLGTTFVSVDGLCVSGDHLFTQKPIAVCTEYGTGESSECKKEEMKILSTPIAYTLKVPVGDSSFDYEEIAQSYPLHYNVSVGYTKAGDIRVVCKKAFSIPTCN